jgi:hypothetical protein
MNKVFAIVAGSVGPKLLIILVGPNFSCAYKWLQSFLFYSDEESYIEPLLQNIIVFIGPKIRN